MENEKWKYVRLREGVGKIIIIIKRISRAPIYRTRWEHRALYNNTDHTHTQSHTHSLTHTQSYTHTHTHTHTHSVPLQLHQQVTAEFGTKALERWKIGLERWGGGTVHPWIVDRVLSFPATQQPCSSSQRQGQEEELLFLSALPLHEEQGPEW